MEKEKEISKNFLKSSVCVADSPCLSKDLDCDTGL